MAHYHRPNSTTPSHHSLLFTFTLTNQDLHRSLPPLNVLCLHLRQINWNSLLAMRTRRAELDRVVDLGLGPHDAIGPHLAAPRRLSRAKDMSLYRELVRERALAGLASDGGVTTSPFVGFGVADHGRVAGTGYFATRVLALNEAIERKAH